MPFLLFGYFPGAPLTDARPAIVTRRRVIEIGDATSGFIDQLPDPRHLLKVDLLDAVRVVVIIGVQTCRKKDDRNPLRSIAVMVAPIIDLLEIGRIIKLEIEFERMSQM